MKPTLDSLPPHAVGAEEGVLGCALIAPETMLKIMAVLNTPSAFYCLPHQIIFKTLVGMQNLGAPIDLITVQQQLKDAGLLDQVGGIEYLSRLQDKVPSAANLSCYLETVVAKFNRRKIISACSQVIKNAADEKIQQGDLMDSVRRDLSGFVGDGSPTGLPELIDASVFTSEAIESPPELIAGVLHKGSKLVFGGSSKSYKTWTLLDLAISVGTGGDWLGFPTKKGRVLFVNFEIQPHAWQKRVAAVVKAKGIQLEPGRICFWNLRGHAANFRQLIPRIIQRARLEKFDFIILDPIYKLYGGHR